MYLFSAINCKSLAAQCIPTMLCQQLSPLFYESSPALTPWSPLRSPFLLLYSIRQLSSFRLAWPSLWVSLAFMLSPSSSHFLIPLPRSSHICFSTPLHLPLFSHAASSPVLSSYTIISSSCTCTVAHCSTVEAELCKEKTDYLLSCKITTRLFPVCWPGLCLGDKQQCLLFFSLPRIPSTLSWLLPTEWIINHFLGFCSLEVMYRFLFFFLLVGLVCYVSHKTVVGKGLNLPQILFIKPMCALQFVLWKASILFRTLTLTQMGKGCLDRQSCADSMLNTMRKGTHKCCM